MAVMETADWAKDQLASIRARRKELNTELATLERLEHHFNKLIPTPVVRSVKPDHITAAYGAKPVKKPVDGPVTPQVLKALENGPMSVNELTTQLGRRVSTGITAVVRFQQKKGTVVAIGDKYHLVTPATDNGVLVS